MSKVYGTVNWVDDPFIPGILYDGAGFFAQYAVIWKVGLYNIKNGFFSCVVRFCYQVVDALFIADAELAVEKSHHLFGARISGPE
jgi:hypothetical protein